MPRVAPRLSAISLPGIAAIEAIRPERPEGPLIEYEPPIGSIELPRLRTGRITWPPRICAAPVRHRYVLRVGFRRSLEMIRYCGMMPLRPLVLVGLPKTSTPP